MGSAAAVTQVNLKHSTARHSRAQHGTAQQSTARHNTGRNSPAQPKTAQPSPTQHSTAQHQRQQQNPLAADQINGAAHVDIHKVHVTVLLDQHTLVPRTYLHMGGVSTRPILSPALGAD